MVLPRFGAQRGGRLEAYTESDSKRMTRLIWILLVLGTVLQVSVTADARTWYVKNDGTGDAPTIRSAVDSSASGDTILVGPGVYEIGNDIWLKDGIVVTSEQGPNETRLVPKPFSYPPYLFVCDNLLNRTEISGFWVRNAPFTS